MQIVSYLVTTLLPPQALPKLSFNDGIPDEWRTLVVVPEILTTPGSVRHALELLEIRFLANQDPEIKASRVCAKCGLKLYEEL